MKPSGGGRLRNLNRGGSEYSGMLSEKFRSKLHIRISRLEYMKSFNYNLPTMKQGRYAFYAYVLTI